MHKSSYAQSVKAEFEKKILCSSEFWKIADKFLRRRKVSELTILKGPKVISFSLDNALLFTFNFDSNSMLENNGHILLDFPSLTEHKICNIYIRVQEVSRLMKSLNSKKATALDKISVLGFKDICPELLTILVKLYNH